MKIDRFRPYGLAVAAAAACVLASGCSPRGDVESRLEKVGAQRLRDDAAVLYKDVFAGPAPTYRTVRANDLPPAFKAMSPIEVGAYVDGFSLAMTRHGSHESGIYVVPNHMAVTPKPSGFSKFERLADGVFWYSIKQ